MELKNKPYFGMVLLAGAALSYSAWGAEIVLLFALACGIMAAGVRLALVEVLGRHSYAIYLVHFAVVSAAASLWPMGLVPLFVLVTGVSLGLSTFVIEPLIERPFNRFGHALALARRPGTVATVA